MNIKELINKCTYGTQGYITSQEDLHKIEELIIYNFDVIDQFKNVIVATNYDGDWKDKNREMWSKYFADVTFIDLEENRGYSHGDLDLENAIVDYCKANDIKWLCKVQNDTVFTEDIWKYEVPEVDFYYMNGFSYETLYKHNFDYESMYSTWFFPQGMFYIINVEAIDYMHDKTYLDEYYDRILNIENYNGKIWEYYPEFVCEEMIGEVADRNNLSKHHLLEDDLYKKLFDMVKMYRVGDPSHKNIMIQGICHFHFNRNQVIQI
jgi:hypothetical protein